MMLLPRLDRDEPQQRLMTHNLLPIEPIPNVEDVEDTLWCASRQVASGVSLEACFFEILDRCIVAQDEGYMPCAEKTHSETDHAREHEQNDPITDA